MIASRLDCGCGNTNREAQIGWQWIPIWEKQATNGGGTIWEATNHGGAIRGEERMVTV